MTARDAGSTTPPYEAAAELLRTLGAPVRVAIVCELRSGPRQVRQLVQAVSVASQPTVSGHLRVLRTTNVVRRQRHGRQVAYVLADELLGRIVAAAVSYASPPHPAANTTGPSGMT